MVWTAIPDADIDADSPVTVPLMSALRDNVEAVANGDAGAPKIQAAAYGAPPSVGAIASLGFFSTVSPSATFSVGAIIAGSALKHVGLSLHNGIDYSGATNGSSVPIAATPSTVSPAGNWQALTESLNPSLSPPSSSPIGLFTRIS